MFSKKNGKPLSTDTIQRILRKAREKAGIDKFFITDKAKNLVIAETRDPTSRVLGARALKKVFERMVEIPVLNLLARAEEGDGLKAGDRVLVDAKDGAMFIFKEAD